MTTNRRQFLRNAALFATGGGLMAAGLAPWVSSAQNASAFLPEGWTGDTIMGLPASEGPYEVTLTEDQWRSQLTRNQFAILRQEKTERAGSSPLDKIYSPGTYHCQGCDLAVYSADHKYNSGTGWPSFYQSLPNAIRVKEDNSLFSRRTEVHCRRCGGHFGHVFSDGPEPTGLRHCLNGIALEFRAA